MPSKIVQRVSSSRPNDRVNDHGADSPGAAKVEIKKQRWIEACPARLSRARVDGELVI